MKYCIHCGKGHAETPKFCSQCGTEWNKPVARTAARIQKPKAQEEYDDEDDEEERKESVASLLGNLRKVVKVTPMGARVISGKEIATSNEFFAIEEERERKASNYNFEEDMAKVRRMPREEIN